MSHKNTSWSPPREKLIELRFERKMTREEIAEFFNETIATVRRWIKDLEIPRPERSRRPKSPKRLSSSGEIVAAIGDGYNSLEGARMKLEGRVIDNGYRGYYLDGHPASADEIVEAAKTHTRQ